MEDIAVVSVQQIVTSSDMWVEITQGVVMLLAAGILFVLALALGLELPQTSKSWWPSMLAVVTCIVCAGLLVAFGSMHLNRAEDFHISVTRHSGPA